MDTNTLVEKAGKSSFYRWILNLSLDRMIPFNAPHGFKVIEVSKQRLKILLPYKRKNFNHIRGLHACALATVSEFATGFLLVSNVDAKKYRLIMQRLEMDYHFQGKMNAYAEFAISDEWLESKIYQPLTNQESVVVICAVKIHDEHGSHLTTGHVHWQIKDWRKVKTKA
jgi:hypothetical protein